MGRKITRYIFNIWFATNCTQRVFHSKLLGFLILLNTLACSSEPPSPPNPDFSRIPFQSLSAYGLFSGKLSSLKAAPGVLPYDLATPLFTDYAHKARFVRIPPGSKANIDETGRLIFPDNTILVKNFFYPADFGKPKSPRDMVETRLLIQRNGQWEAFTYQWNEKGTDAHLMQVGNVRPVRWTDEYGAAHQLEYIIPNKNQCKSCHNAEDRIQPIGPKVRNLNFAIDYPDGTRENQLLKWQQVGYLPEIQPDTLHPAMPNWENPHTGSLADRAAAYLDINCGHCHRPGGPAQTTGTLLHWEEKSLARKGVFKSPVAAGKGSGDRHYGIVPGKPELSILLYRMESTDPGVMMPELGRVVPHKEGIALIREWIASLENTRDLEGK